jgi:site-specific DNA recombinase
MKTFGYVRVSTDKQAERGISLEAQAEKIRAMALVQSVELDEFIVESGESAKSLNRPGMTKLLGMVDAGQVKAVIVAKLDRLTLVLNIMAAVSQWEREAIGERTRDALHHKRSQGERVGNIAFGFRLAGDGQHVEPDPAEQGALTEIRRLRHEGATLRGIAAALNHRAYRTRRGTPWRLESVARVLKQGAVAR